MEINKKHLYSFLILVAIIVLFLLFSSGQDTKVNAANLPSNQAAPLDENAVQKVILSFKDNDYYPNTVTVKANQPVRITLDKSVFGCFRSFTIPKLGLRKYMKSPSDYLEFTPTKKGSYPFSCSMGMGTGTLIVN